VEPLELIFPANDESDANRKEGEPPRPLRIALEISGPSDFCVGYFNLRGWKAVDGLIERYQISSRRAPENDEE
jgi:hypothetical protein